jgi:hypothetical protein
MSPIKQRATRLPLRGERDIGSFLSCDVVCVLLEMREVIAYDNRTGAKPFKRAYQGKALPA